MKDFFAFSDPWLFLIVGGSAWGFWHYCWRPYAVSAFREELFSIRDGLMYATHRNEMPFQLDEPIYTALRARLNSMIRFAHQVSATRIWTFFLIRAVRVILGAPRLKPISTFPSGANQAIREQIRIIRRREGTAMLKFLMKTSPIFFVVAGMAFLFIFAISLMNLFARRPIVAFIKEARQSFERKFTAPTLRGAELQADFFKGEDDDSDCMPLPA